MRINKAQAFLEYAILIIILVGVFMGMNVWVKRSVQQKYRENADTYGQGWQYEKGVTKVSESASFTDMPTPIDVLPGCETVTAAVDALDKEINSKEYDMTDYTTGAHYKVYGLVGLAADLRKTAARMRGEVADIKDAGTPGVNINIYSFLNFFQNMFGQIFGAMSGDSLRANPAYKNAQEMEDRANDIDKQIQDLQSQIDQHKAQDPGCFNT